jgi:hypothetical protein
LLHFGATFNTDQSNIGLQTISKFLLIKNGLLLLTSIQQKGCLATGHVVAMIDHRWVYLSF